MDPAIYRKLIAQEDRHWWFLGRRAIARAVLRRATLPPRARILDLGCGGGGNLPMLAEYGAVHGSEMEPGVREHAIKRGLGPVEAAELPAQFPFPGQTFDLVTMFDVLEHIDQDRETLVEIHKHLNQDGYLLLTVPAFALLTSRHDTLHHHKRRYARAALKRLLEETGYRVLFINYFNFWLFPAALLVRLWERLGPAEAETIGQDIPPAPLNRLLAWLMSSERFLLGLPLPFGVSLVVLAQKTGFRA